tara:strand:- start:3817 stop:3993 length:177 start_codon:yes stop_codon:yes gene_type:complete
MIVDTKWLKGRIVKDPEVNTKDIEGLIEGFLDNLISEKTLGKVKINSRVDKTIKPRSK